MFLGKSDVIFFGPKFPCALRNTRKSFRELYGTVFGPEAFSGLLRNARQVPTTLLASMCRAMPFSARAPKENIFFDVDVVIKKNKKT